MTKCPECGSQGTWKDGKRYVKGGEVQRYLCRSCGYRFSDSKVKVDVLKQRFELSDAVHDFRDLNAVNFGVAEVGFQDSPFTVSKDVCSHRFSGVEKTINKFLPYNRECRVCVSKPEAKNLAEEVSRIEKQAAGATTSAGDVKGRIIEYAWWLKKRGLSKATIETRARKLERLVKLGSDLMNPESVKETIAEQKWKPSTKASLTSIYTNFLKCFGMSWEPPIYKPTYEIPFIPTESEIDQLIAGTGKSMAALLQLLKETAIRIGEACKSRWIDLDPKQKTIRVRAEKNSKPRIFHISDKLLNMLNILPKKSEYIFNANVRSLQSYFLQLRKRLAQRLANPRLKEIHFHTLRHWKATQLYHETKDILYVKEFLGHKKLDSTLQYISIEKALYHDGRPEDFHVKIAETPEEIKGLLEVGFEYVCEKDDLVFFRKRK